MKSLKKIFFAFSITFAVVFGCMGMLNIFCDTKNSFANSNGYLDITVSKSLDTFTEISTAEQFIQFATDVNNNGSKRGKLVADIDLGGKVWTPIGTIYNPYMSSFDGNGYVIKNLTIDATVESSYVGLFGYTYGAKIYNFVLEDVSVFGGEETNYCATIAGYAKNTTISNIYIKSGSVGGKGYVGSIVGYANNSDVFSCKNQANVFAKDLTYGGGLVGYCYSAYATNGIFGCVQMGAVEISESTTDTSTVTTNSIANGDGQSKIQSSYYYIEKNISGAFDIGYYYVTNSKISQSMSLTKFGTTNIKTETQDENFDRYFIDNNFNNQSNLPQIKGVGNFYSMIHDGEGDFKTGCLATVYNSDGENYSTNCVDTLQFLLNNTDQSTKYYNKTVLAYQFSNVIGANIGPDEEEYIYSDLLYKNQGYNIKIDFGGRSQGYQAFSFKTAQMYSAYKIQAFVFSSNSKISTLGSNIVSSLEIKNLDSSNKFYYTTDGGTTVQKFEGNSSSKTFEFSSSDASKKISNFVLYLQPEKTVYISASSNSYDYLHSLHIGRGDKTMIDYTVGKTADFASIVDVAKPDQYTDQAWTGYIDKNNNNEQSTLAFVFSDLFCISIDRSAENPYNYETSGSFDSQTRYISQRTLQTCDFSDVAVVNTNFLGEITGSLRSFVDDNVPTVQGYTPALVCEENTQNIVANLKDNQFVTSTMYNANLKSALLENCNQDKTKAPNITKLKYEWSENQNEIKIVQGVYTGSGTWYDNLSGITSFDNFVSYACGKTSIQNLATNQTSYVGYNNDSDKNPYLESYTSITTGEFSDISANDFRQIILETSGNTMILPGFKFCGYVIDSKYVKMTDQQSSGNCVYSLNGIVDLSHIRDSFTIYAVFETQDITVEFSSYDISSEQQGKVCNLPYIILPFGKTPENSKSELKSFLSSKSLSTFKTNQSTDTATGFRYGIVNTDQSNKIVLGGGETLLVLYSYNNQTYANVNQTEYDFVLDSDGSLKIKTVYDANYNISLKPFVKSSQLDYEFYNSEDFDNLYGHSFENLFWNYYYFQEENKNNNNIDKTVFPIGIFTQQQKLQFSLELFDQNTNQTITTVFSKGDLKNLKAYIPQLVSTSISANAESKYVVSGDQNLTFKISNQAFFVFDSITVLDNNSNIVTNNAISYSLQNTNNNINLSINGLGNLSSGEYILRANFVPATFDLQLEQSDHNGKTYVEQCYQSISLQSQKIQTSKDNKKSSIITTSFLYCNNNQYYLRQNSVYDLELLIELSQTDCNLASLEFEWKNNKTYQTLIKSDISILPWTEYCTPDYLISISSNLLTEYCFSGSEFFDTLAVENNQIKTPSLIVKTNFEMNWDVSVEVEYTYEKNGTEYTESCGKLHGLPNGSGKYKIISPSGKSLNETWTLWVCNQEGIEKTYQFEFVSTGNTEVDQNLIFYGVSNQIVIDQIVDVDDFESLYFVFRFDFKSYMLNYMEKNASGSYELSVEISVGAAYGDLLDVSSAMYEDPENCTFSHWNTQANGSGISYYPDDTIKIYSDTTLYAQYISQNKTVTLLANYSNNSKDFSASVNSAYWKNNDGTFETYTNFAYATFSIDYGSQFPSLIVPIKSGYTFVGWWSKMQSSFDEDPEDLNNNTKLTQGMYNTFAQDTEFYAWWSANTVEVVVDKVLSFAPSVQTRFSYKSSDLFDANSQFVQAYNTLSEGIYFGNTKYFRFDGLYKNASYTGDAISLQQNILTSDSQTITVYAKWVFLGFEISSNETLQSTTTYTGSDVLTLEFVQDTPSQNYQFSINGFSTIKSILKQTSSNQKYALQWSKNGTVLSTQTTSQLRLTNTSESGTYRATLTITVDGKYTSSGSAQSFSKYIDGQVTINKANATVVFDNQKIYDGSANAKNVSVTYENSNLEGRLSIKSAVYVDKDLKQTANVLDAKNIAIQLGKANGESFENFNIVLRSGEKSATQNSTDGYLTTADTQITVCILPFDVVIDIGNQSGQINGAKHFVTISSTSEYLDTKTKKLLSDYAYTLCDSTDSSAKINTSDSKTGVYFAPNSTSSSDKKLVVDIIFKKDGKDLSSNFEISLKSTNTYEITQVVGDIKTIVFDKSNTSTKDANGNDISLSSAYFWLEFEYTDSIEGSQSLSSGWNYFSNTSVYVSQTKDSATISFYSQNLQSGIITAKFESEQVSANGVLTWLWLDNWKQAGENRYNFDNETVDSNTTYQFELSKIAVDNTVYVYPYVKNYAVLTLHKNLNGATGTTKQQVVVLRTSTSQTINLFDIDNQIDTESGLVLDGYCVEKSSTLYQSYTISDSTANIKDFDMYARWSLDFDGIDGYFVTNGSQSLSNLQKTYDGKTTSIVFFAKNSAGNNAEENSDVLTYTWEVDGNKYNTFTCNPYSFKNVTSKTISAKLTISYKHENSSVLYTKSFSAEKQIVIQKYNLELQKSNIDKTYDGDSKIKDSNGNQYIDININLGDTTETLHLCANYSSANVGTYTSFSNISLQDNQNFLASNYNLVSATLSGKISKKQIQTINFGDQVQAYNGNIFVFSGTAQDGGLVNGDIISFSVCTTKADVGVYSTQTNNIDASWVIKNSAGQTVSWAKDNYEVTFEGSLTIQKINVSVDDFVVTNIQTEFDNQAKQVFVTSAQSQNILPSFVDVVYVWTNTQNGQTGSYSHNQTLGNQGYVSSIQNPTYPILAGQYDVVATFVVDKQNIQLSKSQLECKINISKRNIKINIGNLVFENVAKYTTSIDTSQQTAVQFSSDTNMVVDSTKYAVPYQYNISSNPINFSTEQFSISRLLSDFVFVDTIYNQRYVQGEMLTISNGLVSNPKITYQGQDFTDNFEIEFNLSYNINHTYTIVYDTDGGNQILDKTTTFGAGKLSFPTCAKAGYTFAGWQFDASRSDQTKLTPSLQLYNVGMSDLENIAQNGQTVTFVAKWDVSTTNLTIKIFAQDLEGEYFEKQSLAINNITTESQIKINILEDKQTFVVLENNKTIKTVTIQNQSFDGFSFELANKNQKLELDFASGSEANILAVYMSRNTYNLTLQYNNGTGQTIQSYLFGQTVSRPVESTYQGYVFDKWIYTNDSVNADKCGQTESFENLLMPAHDIIVVANYKANQDTKFAVQVLYQNIDQTYDTYVVGQSNPNITLVQFNSQTDAFVKLTVSQDGKQVFVDVYLDSDFQKPCQTFSQQTITLKDGFSFYKDGSLNSDNILTGQILIEENTFKVYAFRNLYTITYVKNNGQENQSIQYLYNSPISMPTFENFVYEGFEFEAWFDSQDFDNVFDFDSNKTMPAQDIILYAKWKGVDVGFNLVLYLQNINDNSYTETTKKIQNICITNDKLYIKEINGKWYLVVERNNQEIQRYDSYLNLEGFTLEKYNSSAYTVLGDGSTTISVYFARDNFNLYVDYMNNDPVQQISVAYQTVLKDISFDKNPTKTGYQFEGFYLENTFENKIDLSMQMPAKDLYLYAKYTNGQTTFELIERTENLDGSFEQSVLTKIAQTNDTIQIEQDGSNKYICVYTQGAMQTKILLGKTGFDISEIAFDQDAKNISAIISGDGSTTVVVTYTRKSYSLTLDQRYDDIKTIYTKKYQQSIELDQPTRKGFRFVGWCLPTSVGTKYTLTSMPAQDLTLWAMWEEDSANLSVQYLFESLDDSNIFEIDQTQTETITSVTGYTITVEQNTLKIKNGLDVVYTKVLKTFEGFEQIVQNTNQTVNADGTTVVQIKFARESYKFVAKYQNGQSDFEQTIKYQSKISELNFVQNPTNEGFSFVDWKNMQTNQTVDLKTFLMPAQDTTIFASWQTSQVKYTIKIEKQNLDETFDIQTYEFLAYTNNQICIEQSLTGLTATEYNANTKIKQDLVVTFDNGFELVQTLPIEKTVLADGSLTINLVFNRKSFDLTFEFNNGQQALVQTIKYQAKITKPENPTKSGYIFAGWYQDQNLTQSVDFETLLMPAQDTTFFASYTPDDATQYQIEYYLMDKNGNYPDTATYSQILCGVTDDTVLIQDGNVSSGGTTNPLQSFEHFKIASHQNQKLEGTILADESLVLKVYFERNKYTLTIVYNNDQPNKQIEQYYQTSYTEQIPTKTGFKFDGWYLTQTFDQQSIISMPYEISGTVTIYAKWQASAVVFNLEILTQNVLDDSYTASVLSFEATTNNLIVGQISQNVIELKQYNGQTEISLLYSYEIKDGFELVSHSQQIVVLADGSATYQIKVDRKTFDLTYVYQNGQQDFVQSYRFEQPVTKPTDPAKSGYTFDGWYKSNTFESSAVDFETLLMPAQNLTLYAKYVANQNTKFVVKYYLQTLNNDFEDDSDIIDEFYATTDFVAKIENGIVTISNNNQVSKQYTLQTFEGFEFDSENSKNILEGSIDPTQTLVLKLYFTRNNCTLTLVHNDFNNTQNTVLTYKYGQSISMPQTVANTGFAFDGWYKDNLLSNLQTFPFEITGDTILYAKWQTSNSSFVLNLMYQTLEGDFEQQQTIKQTQSLNIVKIEKQDNQYVLNIYCGDSLLSTEKIEKTGFDFDQEQNTVLQYTVAPDKSTQISIYFTRQKFDLTYKYLAGDQTIQLLFGQIITKPQDDQKQGYTFDGWYNQGQKFNFDNATMPNYDLELVPFFVANQGTTFTVQYFTETLDGNFEKTQQQSLQGQTDFDVVVEGGQIKIYDQTNLISNINLSSIEGFEQTDHQDQILTTKILGDNSAVLKVYFARKSFTLVFVYGDGKTAEKTIVQKYQTTASIQLPTRIGYAFGGWFEDQNFVNSAKYVTENQNCNFVVEKNLTLYAKWIANGDISFTTNYYLQNIDDQNFTLFESTNLFGTTDKVVQAVQKTYDGFSIDLENSQNVLQGKVDAENTLILNVYYTRNIYNIIFNANGGVGDQQTQAFKYQQAQSLAQNTFVRDGFTFVGWTKKQQSTTVDFSESQRYTFQDTQNINLYALWEIDDNLLVTISSDFECVQYGDKILLSSNVVHQAQVDITYSWYHDDVLVGDGATLQIQNISQSGKYSLSINVSAKQTVGATKYQLQGQSNTLDIRIVQRKIVLSFEGTSFVYNATEQKPTTTVQFKDVCDLQLPQIISTVTSQNQKTLSKNVGNYNLKVEIDDENFVLEGVDNIDFVITPMSVDISDKIYKSMFTKQYLSEDPLLVLQVLEQTTGETLQINLERQQGEQIGYYDLSLQNIPCENPNFEILQIPTDNQGFEIVKSVEVIKVSFVQTDMLTKVYDGNIIDTKQSCFDISNLRFSANVDILDISFEIKDNAEDVGVYDIEISNVVCDQYQNFEFDTQYQFEITPLVLTYNKQVVSKYYDGTTLCDINLTDDILLKDQQILKLVASFDDENANQNIKINTKLVGDSKNYLLAQSFENIFGTILPRDVQVVAKDKTLIYGQFDQNCIFEYQIFAKNGDAFDTEISNTQFDGKLWVQTQTKYRPGSYQILQNSLHCTTGNYNIASVGQAYLTVVQKTITATATYEKYFDGTTDFYGEILLDGVLDGDDVFAKATFATSQTQSNIQVTITLEGQDADCYNLENNNASGIISDQTVTALFDYGFDNIICNSHSAMQYTNVQLLYNKSIADGLQASGYTSLPTPWAEGWDFVGWFDSPQDGNQIFDDTIINQTTFGDPNTTKTFYAQYSYGTVSIDIGMVTYDSQNYDTKQDGGSFTINSIVGSYDVLTNATFNDVLTIVVTSSDQYDFVGFFESNAIDAKLVEENLTTTIDGNTLTLTIQKNMTIYLKFKLKQFTICLNFGTDDNIEIKSPFNDWEQQNGGISNVYDLGTNILLPTSQQISRRGYDFVGWMQDQTIVSDITLSADTTLTALWQAKSFIITLIANTGDEDSSLLNADQGSFEDLDTTKQISVLFDQSIADFPIPVRKGYTFENWVDENKNIWTQQSVCNFVSDKTLYATWTANTVLVQISTTPNVQDIKILSTAITVQSQVFANKKMWTIQMNVTQTLEFECFDIEGYVFNYSASSQSGTQFNLDCQDLQNYSFKLSRMIENIAIDIVYKANLHTYTIQTNQNWGTINAEITNKIDTNLRNQSRNDQNCVLYDGDKTYTILVYSGEKLSIKIVPNKGYAVLRYTFENANISRNSKDQLELDQIVQDGTGNIVFEPQTHTIILTVGKDITTGKTDQSLGSLDVYKQTEQGLELISVANQNYVQVYAKTGESIIVRPNANHGYKSVFDTTLWIIENSDSTVVSYVDGQAFVTISSFEENATITVPFERQKFAIDTVVAIKEDDQTTIVQDNNLYATIDIDTLPDGSLEIDQQTYNTYFYLRQLNIQATITNNAYTFVGWYLDLDGQAVCEKDTYTFDVSQNQTVYIVITLKTYVLEYSADENGKIDQNQLQYVKHGQNGLLVLAQPQNGYKFEKWQVYDADLDQWIDDTNIKDAARQDTNVQGNIKAKAVFVACEISINIQTKFLDGYDSQQNAVYLPMTTQFGYLQKIGDDQKLLQMTIDTLSNQQTSFALLISDGYLLANFEIDDNGQTTFDLTDLENIVVSGYLQDITITITLKAKENYIDIGFMEYKNGEILPYYLTAENKIVVDPEVCASQNGRSKVSVVVNTNKSFTMTAELLNGYEFATDEQGNVYVGILYDGYMTLQYVPNINQQLKNGIYSASITVLFDNILGDAKVFVFTKYTKYPVTFHIFEDESDNRVFDLVVSTDFGEVDQDVLIPTSTGMFFMGWYSQKYGKGLRYIDQNGNTLTAWNFEHKDLYAYWEIAYVTYNVVYIPGTEAISEQIGLSNTLPTALKEFTSNTQFKYYVDNEVILTAPVENLNYQFAYIQIGDQKYTDRTIAFVIPMDTEDFEQTIYIYYKVAISVSVIGGGTATIDDGQITVYLLENETATLYAVASRGYKFAYWTEQNDTTVLSKNSQMQVGYSLKPKTYIANFDGLTTTLEVLDGQHGEITCVKINGQVQELKNGKCDVKLSDYIIIETQADAGYYLFGWYINGKQNSTFAKYQVTVDDVCNPVLTFVPNFVLSNINYTVIYDTNGGNVQKDFSNVSSGFTFTTNYLETNTFKITQNIRYSLDKVLLNNEDISDLIVFSADGGTIEIASNKMDESKRNIVEIKFAMIYWLDNKTSFEGRGTEGDPYTIKTPEQFAMMCYLINNNIPVDSDNKVKYASGYYVLASTVNFEQAFWIPIGTEENPFDGTIRFDFDYKNIVLDKYYSVTCYEGLFGYVTQYAKFLKSSQTHKIAIIVVSSFVGLLIVVVVVFVVTRYLKRKKYQKQSEELLNIPRTNTRNNNDKK